MRKISKLIKRHPTAKSKLLAEMLVIVTMAEIIWKSTGKISDDIEKTTSYTPEGERTTYSISFTH